MFLDDLRSAARSVSRAKALTAVLLISLGIGTGANAAVFSVVDALLFRAPAGVTQASTLATVHTSYYDGSPFGPSSLPDFESIAQSVPAFASLAAVDDSSRANVAIGEYVQSTRVSAVSPQFFATLALEPQIGRTPSPSELRDNAPVAFISHELWDAAARPELEGLTVTVREQGHRVVGVGPPRFRGLQAARFTDVWIPLAAREPRRGERTLALIGRIGHSGSLDDANAQLLALSQSLAEQFPETNRGTQLDPQTPRQISAIPYSPLDPQGRAQTAVIAAIVTGAVVLLLVSACLNAGTLLLSRGFARRREFAVKMALGAPRQRLVRQLLLETSLVALGGAALGLLFANWTMNVMPALFSPEQAAMLDTSLRPPLMLLTVLAGGIAGALFGIAPALHATSSPAALALRADAGGVSGPQGGAVLRSALVGVQLAVSTVLLLATALLIGSLRATLNADVAFASGNIALVSLENPGRFVNTVRGVGYHHAALETLRRSPTVRTVGWASIAPLLQAPRSDFRIAAGVALTDSVDLDVTVISGDYFAAAGMELVEGRAFSAADGALADPVAIVDERLARRYFGSVAVGHHLVDDDGIRYKIVGVVRPRKYRALQDGSRTTIYYPLAQHYQPQGHLLIQLHGEAAPHLASLERLLTRIDDAVGIQRVVTLERHLNEALVVERLTTTLVGICGVLALAMAVLGAYGVMNDAVQRRTREIGLRVALGAARFQVARVVLRDVVAVLIAGLGGGIVLSIVLRRIIGMHVSPLPSFDVPTLTSAPALLTVIVALAAVFPLRRALRVSAAVALRAE